jgi:Domain of unknown function (DUF1330)
VTVYAIAALKFADRAADTRWAAAFIEVFLRYCDRDKGVLMAFPDEIAFREWAESPDYQRISEDRRAGADTVVLLVQALSKNAW